MAPIALLFTAFGKSFNDAYWQHVTAQVKDFHEGFQLFWSPVLYGIKAGDNKET